MAEPETTLEMVARHVRDDLVRIAGQEALILRLELKGPDSLLPGAYKLLTEMRQFQISAGEHLERELAKGKDVRGSLT